MYAPTVNLYVLFLYGLYTPHHVAIVSPYFQSWGLVSWTLPVPRPSTPPILFAIGLEGVDLWGPSLYASGKKISRGVVVVQHDAPHGRDIPRRQDLFGLALSVEVRSMCEPISGLRLRGEGGVGGVRRVVCICGCTDQGCPREFLLTTSTSTSQLLWVHEGSTAAYDL